MDPVNDGLVLEQELPAESAGGAEIILPPITNQPSTAPPVLTPREVAHELRLGRNSVYEAIRNGTIPSVRIGRRLLIPRAALDRLLGVTD